MPTIQEIASQEGYKAIVLSDTEATVSQAYTGDLLSDVMGNAPDDSALVTIQAHKNTVAVASLAGIKVIVICNGRAVPDDMAAAAKEEHVAIIATGDDQFTASWKIAKLLKLVGDA
ncbi:MAG: iron-sulfur binding hydrogenase [Sphaerochaetaceae bacterium]|jgi:hypothetical protein